MAKPLLHGKPSRDRPCYSFCVAVIGVVILFWTVWTLTDSLPTFSAILSVQDTKEKDCLNLNQAAKHEPSDKTFYDDPDLRYTVDQRIDGWDEKRRDWLKHHPAFLAGANNRLLVLTGSQPSTCKNPGGDHLLLRFFKNKADYCRIHGYPIFYNNLLLHPKMNSYWAKIPVVKAAMLAHPEVEWILWIDSDAIFTDMEFTIPFERYEDHNLVIHGWPDMIYEKKSWVAVNAGIFLIRNCQWSMDFMDTWAQMGPISPDYDKWAKILTETLKDKAFPNSDDQSALVYLLLKEKRKWGDRIYVENTYDLHGYWLPIVDKFEEFVEEYEGIERKEARLRRRHAEVVTDAYAAERNRQLDSSRRRRRRPFITHFTGCQPCNGEHNPDYKGDSCWVGMERALNFADNQVLRSFGFGHPDLRNGSYVRPLPYDYPRRQ
ncbi:putative glycosyltransferase 7 [Andrographis paniculata]|uniref:putative glycosyltransferase 7 n=1 Tax=Andrographis paniculata TaxID=175694 RepID=UPI0021E932B5|nr:putative glycosyltransferase 7 [Andrographis paniculata]